MATSRRCLGPVIVLGCIALAPLAHAAPVIRMIEVSTPRSYGYSTGDQIRHDIRLVVDERYALDRTMLPKRGPVNRGLWLEDVQVRESGEPQATAYLLALTYQLLSPPPVLTRLSVPELTLFVKSAKDRVPVTVQAWGFSAAPLTERPESPALPFVTIQPSLPPTPLSPFRHVTIVALCVILFCSAIVMLLYLHWRLPWVARSNGPFARALRELETLRGQSPAAGRYDAALRHTHRAFNDTAGVAIFAETQSSFFGRHPEFQVRRDSIVRFFNESGDWFFAGPRDSRPPDLKPLIELCRACRDIERGIL